MNQESLTDIIVDQTKRALWEVKNVIECVPDQQWNNEYCDMPLWKHIYHMLHSLDLWFINPRDCDFKEPYFHEDNLNNLDIKIQKHLNRNEINDYFTKIQTKVGQYISTIKDENLLEMPEGCEYAKFTLIIAQYRHLHTHMGMIMGFIIAEYGLWPKVVGLEGKIILGEFGVYF